MRDWMTGQGSCLLTQMHALSVHFERGTSTQVEHLLQVPTRLTLACDSTAALAVASAWPTHPSPPLTLPAAYAEAIA